MEEMRSGTRSLARRVGAVAAATALAALGMGAVGAASASASTASASTASGHGTLLKQVTNKYGTLRVYTVSPADASACTGSDPLVCLYVTGTGLYVSKMENLTHNYHPGTLDMQIKDPNGNVIVDSGPIAASVANHALVWEPNTYENAGYYCAFSDIDGGTYTGECIDVTN